MATITINIDNDTNRAFREAVARKLGRGKGILGRAVEEALMRWAKEKEQQQIAERQLDLVKKGIYNLKGWKFDREEIYERQ